MKIGEFFVELGVNVSDKKLKDFIGDLSEMRLGTLANITSLAALAYELIQLGREAANAAAGFELFQNQTGLSWHELQKWQIVAQQANVSAEAVSSSVTNLQKQMAEIRLGRGNIAPFQLLGIGVQGNAFDVLDKIRDRIKGLDAATATNIIEQMGISGDMINVLRLSDDEFQKLSRTVHGMTTAQEQQFLRTKQSLVQLGLAFKYTGYDIISHFLTAFEKLDPLMTRTFHGFLKLRDILIALAIYFFPVTAAVLGLLVVLDDLAVFFSGGKSLTGEAWEGLKKFGAELKEAFNLGDFGKLANMLQLSQGLGPIGGSALVGAGYAAKSMSNVFHINVTGSGAAVDIASEVTRQISRHFSKSEQELNNQGH